MPIPNPFSFVGDKIGSAIRGLLHELVQDFLKNLAEPVLRYVLHTPDLLAEPTLRRLWLVSLGALLLLAALLVCIAGTAMITGSSTRIGMAARQAVGVRPASALLTAAVCLPWRRWRWSSRTGWSTRGARRGQLAYDRPGFDRAQTRAASTHDALSEPLSGRGRRVRRADPRPPLVAPARGVAGQRRHLV